MDILLNSEGDIMFSPEGDIILADSVAQKIRIKILWFAAEWRWDEEKGLPYIESLFIKNPDTDHFERLIREQIFDVDEVTEVKSVSVTYNKETRKATIRYTALTDFETIKEEVSI